MEIEKLSDDIINQIAAGEVIENPSAVVKELIENSIDADSSKIDIIVKNSGFDEIIVYDNGEGISSKDLLKAPLRHATSKIKKFDDLYSIESCGFRGEALASIFSVADTMIISKKKNNTKGYQISSRNVSQIKESGREGGTTVVVKNLFNNVPARKKYLKSYNMELKSIIDVVTRYALYYYNKKITLKHNDKFLINKPIFKSLRENVIYLLGKELQNELINLDYSFNGIRIQGFIGNPNSITYSYAKNQYIFVNSRFVKSKLIKSAVIEGFGDSLMGNRNPLFILLIEVDPEIIDVNVHPTKIEVKFENELEIFELVKKTIKKVIKENDLIKKVSNKDDFNLRDHVEINNSFTKDKRNSKYNKSYFSEDVQKSFNFSEDVYNYNSLDNKNEIIEETEYKKDKINVNLDKKYGLLYDILLKYRIVGVINKTYIILETPNEMIMIDFHAAQEKCNYENLINMVRTGNIKTQKLLKKYVIDLDNQEKLIFEDNKKLFFDLGFMIEDFGKNSIVVIETPVDINSNIIEPKIVKEILYDISLDKKFKNLEKNKLDFLAMKACKMSIKSGYEISYNEIKELVENLKRLENPFNCPHGRPVVLRYNWYEIDKLFKRIV